MSTTTDFSKFRHRERVMAADLLNAWNKNGLPEDFDASEVTFMMNQMSGNVFLTNSEYQVAMMNGDTLESFYSSPYEGKEGFFDDLLSEYEDMHHEDQEWFRNIAENIGRSEEIPQEAEDEDETV